MGGVGSSVGLFVSTRFRLLEVENDGLKKYTKISILFVFIEIGKNTCFDRIIIKIIDMRLISTNILFLLLSHDYSHLLISSSLPSRDVEGKDKSKLKVLN